MIKLACKQSLSLKKDSDLKRHLFSGDAMQPPELFQHLCEHSLCPTKSTLIIKKLFTSITFYSPHILNNTPDSMTQLDITVNLPRLISLGYGGKHGARRRNLSGHKKNIETPHTEHSKSGLNLGCCYCEVVTLFPN